MAVAFKSIGALGQVAAASNPVPTPAVAAGDLLVLTIVSLGSSVTFPAGWAEITPPLDLSGAYMHTWWKYADTAAGAGTTTVSAPGQASAGWVTTFTGAANTAPAREFVHNPAGLFADSPALTGAGFRMVGGIVWGNRPSASAPTTNGSITASDLNTRLWGSWSGFMLGTLTADVTAASGGTLRFNWAGSGNIDSHIFALLIEEAGSEPEPPEPVNLLTYFDSTEHAAEPRYWDGEVEHGFWYPDGRTGPAAHTLTYWDGSTEHLITVPEPAASLVDGLSYIAHGDSSGALQTSGGVDYTASQTWPHRLAGHLGTTCTNHHVSSSTAIDVFERLNRNNVAARWIPGSADFVTVFVGGNDLVHTHDQAGGQRGYKNAIKAISGLLRMDGRVLASSGSETGSWSGSNNGSGGVRQTSGTGATLTMSFTGTDAMLIVLAPRTGAGANYTVTLDGGDPITDTTNNSGATAVLSGSWAPVPHYFTGLADTSHTVTITRTGGSGALVVDSIVTLADEEDWPYVLFGPIVDGEDIWELAGSPPYPTRQTVADFRDLQRAALVEAGAKKQAIMLADHWQRAVFNDLSGIVINDGYHWNLAGHILAGHTAHQDVLRAFPVYA